MKQQLILIGAIFMTGLCLARGQGADDRYVQVYNLVQEADALNESGQGRDAAVKYFEAQKALKSLQADYPDWNGSVVKFRLSYIASKLEPLTQKAAPINPPPSLATTNNSAGPSGPDQLKDL